MLYMVDSNVLLRLPQRGDPLHAVVRRAIRTLKKSAQQRSIFRFFPIVPLARTFWM
jgi:hypothetical protein